MKIPDYFNKPSSHKTTVFNTMTLTGVSLMWGIMLNLISPWWSILCVLTILVGYGSEIEARKIDKDNLSL
jgi:hypothetical protein